MQAETLFVAPLLLPFFEIAWRSTIFEGDEGCTSPFASTFKKKRLYGTH